MLSPPVLSEFDPVLEAEGSVDPLSLARTYEHLADKVLPALTVRMSRIRFVTAIAAGARVCADWGQDDLAKDGVTPPWLVFEWFVVEGLVRRREKLRADSRRLRIQVLDSLSRRRFLQAQRSRRPARRCRVLSRRCRSQSRCRRCC